MNATEIAWEPWTDESLHAVQVRMRMLGEQNAFFTGDHYDESFPDGSWEKGIGFQIRPRATASWQTVSRKQFLLFLNQHRIPFAQYF